jgi:hypothetical protein
MLLPSTRRGGQVNARAIAIGGGAFVVLGVILAILVMMRPSAEPTAVESSGSPSPSASADAGSSVEASSSPAVEPTPGATEAPTLSALANRAVAEVAVAGLNLRREPGGGAEILGTLDEGARVFVIGVPQAVDDVAWYRVAVIDGPYSGCTEQYCPRDIGWVADGGTAAGDWLRVAQLDCPSSPMTAEQLETLHPLERLSCYGGRDIVVTATLDVCYCDANVPYTWDPFWLAIPLGPFLLHETSVFIRFEESPPSDLAVGDVVRATVAMEHDAAPTCRTEAAPGFFGPLPSGESPPAIQMPDRAQTVLDCRTQLVVKSYEVIGFEDVSLPGY